MGRKASSGAENIKVLVRCRPLSEKEHAQGYKSCVDLDLTEHTVTVRSIVGEPDRWTFDAVINNTFSQRDIFTQFIMPLVDSVLEGYNATVFAYGQSGSGKTHTMTGKIDDPELKGVTPRCFDHIFERIAAMKAAAANMQFSMYVSFIELYNGKVQDLLARQQVPLALKENKDKTFYVQGAHIPQVKSPDDIFRHMEEGNERRRVASTDLNADSSRSHSVFSLIIECTEICEDGDSRSVTSKLNLVDLAGSERQSKTGALGDTLREGCNINLSLSALGTVIDTIVKGRGHVPFRSSPLTMLLKDSLGGSSKTVMFANIGPSEHNFSETVSTLRFADRAKQIKNKPVVNMDTKDQKILELTELVHELREKLKRYDTEGTGALEREVEELREKVGELEVSLDSAVRAREADAVDFENFKAKLNMERQATTSRVVELEDLIGQLQNDLQIMESSVTDERLQREEALRLCSQYLRGDDEEEKCKPITTLNELEAVLQDRAHGKHSQELARLHNAVQKLGVEAKQMRKEHKAVTRELEEKLHEAQSSLKSTEAKLRKANKELNELREGREEASQSPGGAAASSNEVAELRTALENAQQQLEDKGALAQIEVKLQKMQSSHEKTVTAYLTQLQKAKEALSNPGANDSLIVQQLRAILAEDDKSYSVALSHMSDMHNFMQDLKSAMREAQAVPLAAISGNADASRDTIKKIEVVDANEAGMYAGMLSNLHNAVDKAQTRRNKVLDAIAALPDAPPDFKEELSKLMSENAELRQMYKEAMQGAEAAQARVVEEQRRSVAEGTLQAKLEKMRRHYEKREGELLAAMKVDESNGDAKAVLALLSKNAARQTAAGVSEAAQKEIEDLRNELEEERAKSEGLLRAKEAQQEELKSMRKEAAESERRYVDLEGKMNEMVSEYERQLEDAHSSTERISELAARLKERTDQLDQMRGLLEKQKALIVKSNEKSEELQHRLRETNAAAERTLEVYRQKLQERDENFQSVLNQRLEEYAQGHRGDVTKQEEKSKKLRKKIKKLESEVDRLKEEYDRKVCECEDQRNTVEEQKVELMRLLRRMGQTEEEAEVYEKKEKIQNALERAKEEQRRKKDLFALGEVANVRRAEY
ncbi:putative OSM3-like kinesin [Trypanosoma conorhini]|uniref:Putative OSM3-like kinesin n=1 Tax=Trypanosoma conorhini TaxID=83891 RepID=A0A3R7NPF1_9TRYP|nr:putative OSM3-like kinesin [Trypanosoma conorhini]RNF21348.1 putative OSM3-like kinesin [Trypanosoma conorhini]